MKLSSELVARLARVKTLVLDMDGVLVDTEPLHVEAFRRYMDELDITYEDEFIHGFIGYSIAQNVATINRTFLKGREVDVAQGERHRDSIYLSLIREAPLAPVPGVIDLIDFCLNEGMTLALASSSSREQVDTILDNLEQHPETPLVLRRTFSAIVTGDEVPQRKPAPDIYQSALKKLNARPDHSLAVEDSPAGVSSAVAAGLTCIALRSPFIKNERLRHAHLQVDHLSEVVELLMNY